MRLPQSFLISWSRNVEEYRKVERKYAEKVILCERIIFLEKLKPMMKILLGF